MAQLIALLLAVLYRICNHFFSKQQQQHTLQQRITELEQ